MSSAARVEAVMRCVHAVLVAVLAAVSFGSFAAAQNQVLVVDGDGDFALAKEIPGYGGATAIALDLWVRAEGPASGGLLVGVLDGPQTEGWSLRATCDGAATFLVFETRHASSPNTTVAGGAVTNFCDGGWHHVAAVDDGVATTLYLDGQVHASVGPSLQTPWDLENAFIGVGGTVVQLDGFFHGAFDDVRIWRRVLSPVEIHTIASGGAPLSTDGLVTHYRYEGDLFDSQGGQNAIPAGDLSFAFETVEPRALVRFPGALSVSAGGVAHFTVDAGVGAAGRPHFLLGSTSGTTPPLPVQYSVLPLVRDAWLLRTVVAPNTPPYGTSVGASFGVLDMHGRATVSFTVPVGTSAALAGVRFHHAALVLEPNGALVLVTNPVELVLVP